MRLKKDKNNTYFHPFEVTFSGYSNSGKTTLISKLVSHLSIQFDIGYFKHDTHKFVIDHQGKDTWEIQKSGAKTVFINDPTHSANISFSPIDQVSIRNKFIDSDFMFIEGHKHSKLPKIVIMSEESKDKTIEDINAEKITDIDAIITESELDLFNGKYPHFQRDNIQGIINFILERFEKKVPKKIKGLILTGGKSLRMQEDKGGLVYHQNDQITHTLNLMSEFCDEVFISCKEDQKNLSFLNEHKLLFDSFPGGGPSTGIISAQNMYPDTPWLVIGCDLPYLDKKTISSLIKQRNPYKLATCFLNPVRHWPEPICTIYEPKSYQKLVEYFSYNKPCPRKVLFNSNIKTLELENKMALENVNTPEQKDQAIEYIKNNGDNYAN